MKPGVSIVIVSYQSAFYLRLCIENIRKFTHRPYEVIVYDNGSKDGSVEYLRAQADWGLKLHEGANNSLTHGQAIDLLISYSKCDKVCVIDPDAHPTREGWLDVADELTDTLALIGPPQPRIAGVFEKAEYDYDPNFPRYISPSFCVGWSDTLLRFSFEDNYPTWDTGGEVTLQVLANGMEVKRLPIHMVDFGNGILPKPCNYDNRVFHSWWGGRVVEKPEILGYEVEKNYPDVVKAYLRDKWKLAY